MFCVYLINILLISPERHITAAAVLGPPYDRLAAENRPALKKIVKTPSRKTLSLQDGDWNFTYFIAVKSPQRGHEINIYGKALKKNQFRSNFRRGNMVKNFC